MRLLLYLAVVVCCEAGRITRDLEHHLFPNFRTVYHGHGATSYQHVQIESHGSIPILKHHHPKHTYAIHHNEDYFDRKDHKIVSIAVLEPHSHPIEEHYVITTAAPYSDDHVEHVAIEAPISSKYYEKEYEDEDYINYQSHYEN